MIRIQRRFVEDRADWFWVFCVEYAEGTSTAGGRERNFRQRAKDYREILNAEDFALFALLRELRKEIAQAEGIPIYTVFNNEQLAEMSRVKCGSKVDLEKIAGVGDARIEKYGARFLDVIQRRGKPGNATDGKPVRTDSGVG